MLTEVPGQIPERSSSLPTLKSKYYIGPTIRVRPKVVPQSSKVGAEDVMKNYYDIRLSPDKKLDRFMKNATQSSVDRFLHKSLLGKLQRSILDESSSLTQSFSERANTENQINLQITKGTVRTKEFLDPYSTEFFNQLDHIHDPANLDYEKIHPNDLAEFKTRQDRTFALLKRIYNDNIMPKVFARAEVEEVGGIYFQILDKMIDRYKRGMDSFDKMLVKYLKLVDAAKNDNFYVATKNERNLYNSIKYINNLYNPLIELNPESRENYSKLLEEIRVSIKEQERLDIIERFERDMMQLNEHVRKMTDRNIVLEQENQKLMRLNNELSKRFEQEKNVIAAHNNQIFQDMILKNFEEQNKRRLKELHLEKNGGKPEEDPDDSTVSEDLNEIEHRKHGINLERESLITEIHYLKQEVQKIDGKLQKTTADYDKVLAEKTKLDHELHRIKQQMIKQKVKTQDASTQVKHTLAAPTNRIVEGGERDYSHAQINSLIPNDQGIDWLFEISDLICQDKLVSDLRDDADCRPRKSLMDYCKEWFLLKFGIQKVAATMLRDFLFTIKKQYTVSIRFRTLGMLLGINEIFDYHDDQLGNVLTPSVKAMRKAIVASSIGCSIYLKSLMATKPVARWADQLTFHPDIDDKDLDVIEDKDLKKVIQQIIQEFTWPDAKKNILMEQFQLFVESEIYDRILGKNNLTGKKTKKRDYDDEDLSYSVRIDCFTNFLVDKMALLMLQELEEVYTYLSASSDNYSKAAFSLDNYREAFFENNISRSYRWIESSYFKLFEKEINQAAMLLDVIVKLVPSFYESSAIVNGQKLPKDGYMIIPSYFEKMKLVDLEASVVKYRDVRANLKFFKKGLDLVRHSSQKISKDHDNVEDLNTIDKDILYIESIIQKDKLTNDDIVKAFSFLSTSWSRLRMVMRRNNMLGPPVPAISSPKDE